MSPRSARVKRAFDLLVAVPGAIVSLPVVAAAVVAVRLESPGNPIYVQERIGRDGRPFAMYKLRTMVSGAERIGAGLQVSAGDARITRLGSLLRRSSLDELPNLWNVVKGEMAIVGPRPTLGYQVERYTPHQRRRLEVRPGITGWAQVHGRAALPWAERIELDVWYVDHVSPALDLRILWRTIPKVFGGGDLYRGPGAAGWAPTAPTAPAAPSADE